MLAIGDTILRAINFVLLSCAIGLTGSLAASTINHYNPQVSFAVFASAFGLLTSSIYGVLAYFIAALAWPVILWIFDFLNFVFTFAAACAIAANIHCHSCGNKEYRDHNTIIQGSTQRCRKAQASVAFLYISAFVFIASGVFSFISMMRGGAFSYGRRPTAPKVGLPTMSQV